MMPASYLNALVGGTLIGLAAGFLLLFNGRILGISGIAGVFSTKIVGLLRCGLFRKGKVTLEQSRAEILWRALFLGGLLVGGGILFRYFPQHAPQPSPAGLTVVAVAGLLVGIGSRMGMGCTSGHGICGMARGSGRSLLATIFFMSAGVVTVWLVKRWV